MATTTRKKGYHRPKTLFDMPNHFCAGCGHGTVHRIIAEIVEEQNLRSRIIGMAPVGCAVLSYFYFDFDCCEAAHGRTPAVATGIKRALPDHIVYSYQGDGDLAAIGTAEIIHTANRGENISVIFVNNSVYGMTQGQMAPTTLVGQKTSTTPKGRDAKTEGHPIHVCEMLATLHNAVYLARTTLTTPAEVRETKKAIERAFLTQEKKKGFSLVEVLSPCPTYWRKTPSGAMQHIRDVITEEFPIGVFRDWEE